jgi:hypothetical protein
MDTVEELALVTHQAVVDTLPASIRRDFEEPDAGELYRLPWPPQVHEIQHWGSEWVTEIREG